MSAADRGLLKRERLLQADIIAEIHKRGSTLADLSRQSGLNRSTLQGVFYKRYPKGQALVASFIGRSRHELWPEWYAPDDKLLPLGGRPQAAKDAA